MLKVLPCDEAFIQCLDVAGIVNGSEVWGPS